LGAPSAARPHRRAGQSGGIDLPVDDEHQNDKPEAKLKGPVPAAGWIKEMRSDETGIWGRVEWTATARELIERKEYRYLSPVILHNKAGQIMRDPRARAWCTTRTCFSPPLPVRKTR
jgi:phage I-like protein